MPDPVSYLKASIAAVAASAMIVLAFRLILRKTVHSIAAVVCVLAVGVGIATGYGVLQFSWTWPPANALNRFLMIVLPATMIVELVAAISGGRARLLPSCCSRLGRSLALPSGDTDRGSIRIPADPAAKVFGSRFAICCRVALYAFVVRILLHDSVYLSEAGRGNPETWSFAKTLAVFGGSFAALIAGRSLLCRLSERTAPGSITISLALTIVCTGLATMMAGYIKGGAAAIPLAAALVGTTLASPLLAKGPVGSGNTCLQGTIGIGVSGLLSLLFVGHYFGQLTGPHAIVLFLTPLLCWISELPGLRLRPVGQKSGVRFIAVTMVLSAVLFSAKQDFDRKLAPLLVGVSSHTTGIQLSSGAEQDLRRRVGQAAAKPRRPTIVLHTSWAGARVARWSHPTERCPRPTRVQQNTVNKQT